jgi:Zn-dependent protease
MDLKVMLVLYQLVVLVFAFSVHEAAHAWAAMRLGDATAYMMGRVTLNPVRHIDPWGSIAMPLVAMLTGFPLIGWAKPCPVTLRNFRKVKRDDILTTMAGPASNLLIALAAALLLALARHVQYVGDDAVRAAMDLANGFSTDMATLPTAFPIALLLYYSILTNLLLFVFNLIPIPPLDGSRVFRYLLPYNAAQTYDRIGSYGVILLFFVAGRLMMPIYHPLIALFDSAVLAL